ncbi:hypothetical protein RYZ27_01340 [Hyphomonas sp. FCG-A18]|jgi:hypothetical protein|uniref:hypothetical protein n=1 Tax=Hyphomonas sp. FCG-A18 TaxID=3080019 RepID=UPI002B2B265D|nr:hypothetical protein RYZ27_01340 [Hyphomonas sp. FCG-A18]
MSPVLSGLSLYAVALATLLSAFVRLIQSGQLRQRVMHQMTGVRELAELSGITDPRDLQDAFGPPGMDRVWRHVTLLQITSKRQFIGYLMSDPRVHIASMIAAVLALIIPHWTGQLVVLIAAVSQAGAWLSATRLPK